jgi:hypothetical protein
VRRAAAVPHGRQSVRLPSVVLHVPSGRCAKIRLGPVKLLDMELGARDNALISSKNAVTRVVDAIRLINELGENPDNLAGRM